MRMGATENSFNEAGRFPSRKIKEATDAMKAATDASMRPEGFPPGKAEQGKLKEKDACFNEAGRFPSRKSG